MAFRRERRGVIPGKQYDQREISVILKNTRHSLGIDGAKQLRSANEVPSDLECLSFFEIAGPIISSGLVFRSTVVPIPVSSRQALFLLLVH